MNDDVDIHATEAKEKNYKAHTLDNRSQRILNSFASKFFLE